MKRFNEAAGYYPRKQRVPRVVRCPGQRARVASMRPRGITRGNGTMDTVFTCGECGASMRPRGITRGNFAPLRVCRHVWPTASMRPRGITRGNSIGLTRCIKTASRPRGITRGNFCISAIADAGNRFNEAAGYYPRKPSRPRTEGYSHLASMRPRGITRGNGPGRTAGGPGRASGRFNEAAGYYPRKRPRPSAGGGNQRGFNEAAGYYPRKLSYDVQLRGGLLMLQ